MIEMDNHPRTLRQYVRLYLTGFAMGLADLIPGVSGGTMAFVLGIYHDLLKAIKSFNLELLQKLLRGDFKAVQAHVPWPFLGAVLAGLVSAVLLLARVMSWLLEHQPVYLFAFFFGLIIASILAIGYHLEHSPKTWAMLVLGTLIGFAIVNLIPVSMPNDPLTLFLSGAVAIMAMILPGISGSFILLILGQYDYVLNGIKDLNLLVILPVMLGAAVGLLVFVRLLTWLLDRFYQVTVALLVGFMAGSLWKIWPWKVVLETRVDRHGEVVPLVEANVLPNFASLEFVLALGLVVFGFVLFSYLDHLASRNNPLFLLLTGKPAQPVATKQPGTGL